MDPSVCGNAKTTRIDPGTVTEARGLLCYGLGTVNESGAKSMKKIELSLCMASEHEVWPVFDGSAKFDGIDLLASAVPAPELHLRQIRNAEFNAAELGFGRLLIGDTRWVGIPVFPNRRMFHTRALVHRDSGIEKPSDLKCRKVVVPSFWMSAVMWSLGVLRDEYGVKPGDMEYWMERDPGQWKDTKQLRALRLPVSCAHRLA